MTRANADSGTYYATSDEARRAQQSSRRHTGNEAHFEAVKQHATAPNGLAKWEAALIRAADRRFRSHAKQLALLDKRLGAGIGAVRERARLQAMMTAD